LQIERLFLQNSRNTSRSIPLHLIWSLFSAEPPPSAGINFCLSTFPAKPKLSTRANITRLLLQATCSCCQISTHDWRERDRESRSSRLNHSSISRIRTARLKLELTSVCQVCDDLQPLSSLSTSRSRSHGVLPAAQPASNFLLPPST
jgi:hypothetical protein